MAYNAKKLSKIVEERDSAQNWLVYFQIKHTRNPAIRPMTKVASLYLRDLHSFSLGFMLLNNIEIQSHEISS
jgi:hypothetical protein